MSGFVPIYHDLYGPLIDAACALVRAHEETDSMLEAIAAIEDDFAVLDQKHLILLWIGINAKARNGRGAK